MKTGGFKYIGTFLLLFSLIDTVKTQTVDIDMSNEHQLIRGFGGMNHPVWRPDLTEDLVHLSYGNAPGQIGLSIFRTQVPTNPDDFETVVPSALIAYQEHNATVFASPWNPPAEMLDTNGQGYWYVDPDMYADYTNHLNSFIEHMDTSGIPLYAVSVQNEPDMTDWTTWNATQMINYLRAYGDSIETLVMAPESFQFRSELMDPILNDSVTASKIDIVVGHIYGGGLTEQTLALNKGKEVWMTEHLTGSVSPEQNNWTLALELGKEISDCMESEFSAYVWWYIQRFYSLISEGGIITDKGYVMSQFSKFIRPGAVRIEGTVTPASDVYATAYKTDSSLAVVVVNMNSSDVTLDFNIQNGTIDTLVQFTTSGNKKMINDGGIPVIGNTFTATVDAASVTTFTTHAGNSPRPGNIPPESSAGEDIELTDEDGNGVELISFDGTSSSDSDGEIVRYNWDVDGLHVSADSIYDYNMDIGEHTVILSVTDNDGATDSDTFNVTINSIYNTELWFEVECATGSTWELVENQYASNGYCVRTPAGIESVDAPSADTADQINISFQVSEAGPYKVWGRVIAPSATDDSFWVTVDNDTTWALWNNIPTGSDWHWDDVHTNSNDLDVMVYDLDEGYHTLTIVYREDGALLDKIFIANNGAIPSGTGDDAEDVCPEKLPSETGFQNKNLPSVSIYPNPTDGKILIKSSIEFNEVAFYRIDGLKVYERFYSKPVSSIQMEVNLPSGFYFIHVKNGLNGITTKLLVE